VYLSGANSLLERTVFGFGLVVALSTAVESLFRFGDCWRHYRQMELLKAWVGSSSSAAGCMRT
jgi:hypothetical protein